MLLNDLVRTSNLVAATSSRLEKTAALSALLRQLTSPNEVGIAVAFLSGSPRHGKVGVGGAGVFSLEVAPSLEPTLSLGDVDEAFGAIAATTGAGSARRRREQLTSLLGRATADEQHFLMRLLVGELRQGALEGVLVDAVALAAGVPAGAVRRAAMLCGSLGEVAREALAGGVEALARYQIEVLRPVDPMLADSAASVPDALGRLGRAAFEWKIDGARIQVHKAGPEVRIFSRNLRDVTAAIPEIAALVASLPTERLVLDGEVIALRPDGTPLPFQETMRRFGRRLDVERLQQDVPVTPFFFDCLVRDDRVLVDEPLEARVAALGEVVPAATAVPRLVTDDEAAAEAFLAGALAIGHEGVMAKDPAAPYAAGRRGQAWLKIKQVRTLDLVVLAAEWGSGRRQGWLSNLHLGARAVDGPGFVMLGKTFKGLTDEMLAWQTTRLLGLETRRDRHVVFVRPELVVEIAFNDVQRSPQYPAGLALRFARVKGYRHDKPAAAADTIDAVRAVYRQQTGAEPPPMAAIPLDADEGA
jgi:DNA ligase-1